MLGIIKGKAHNSDDHGGDGKPLEKWLASKGNGKTEEKKHRKSTNHHSGCIYDKNDRHNQKRCSGQISILVNRLSFIASE